MSLLVPFERELTDREKTILRAVIQLFILNASPIGSRMLSRYVEQELKLSAATIRNVMSDLEDLGYITHPHTSAGRMPTDKGYRLYVDSLMQYESISTGDQKLVDELVTRPRDTILKDASRILGMLAKALAIVKVPRFSDIVVRRIDLFPLSSEKYLVVLALESDLVKTVTLETPSQLTNADLNTVVRFLNERLSGKSLRVVGDILSDIPIDVTESDKLLLRLFVEQADKLTLTDDAADVHVAGAPHLLQHPEFENPDRMRSVIELMENEDVIIHVVDTAPSVEGVTVRIGNELQHDQFSDYSLIATTYRLGTTSGSIALIGPKRMHYSRLMALVQTVGSVLSTKLDHNVP